MHTQFLSARCGTAFSAASFAALKPRLRLLLSSSSSNDDGARAPTGDVAAVALLYALGSRSTNPDFGGAISVGATLVENRATIEAPIIRGGASEGAWSERST